VTVYALEEEEGALNGPYSPQGFVTIFFIPRLTTVTSPCGHSRDTGNIGRNNTVDEQSQKHNADNQKIRATFCDPTKSRE
jgi:hypothetical protein